MPRVVSEDKEIKVPASEIVPGDILVLAEGDNMPADARLVEEYGLRTNNASLTGEIAAGSPAGQMPRCGMI